MKHDFTLTLSARCQQLGWIYLIFQLLLLPSLLYALSDAMGVHSDALLNGLYYIINFSVCMGLFFPMLRTSIRSARESLPEVLLTAAAGFVLLQLADLLIGALILRICPDFSNVNDSAVGDLIRQQPSLMLLCIGLLVPIAEECLFRGLLFAPTYHSKPRQAYALSVVFFAVIHVAGYIGTYSADTLLLCFVQYLPAGMVLCLALARTDTLITPILIHSAVNLFSILTLR